MRKKFYTAAELVVTMARKELGNIDFNMFADSLIELLMKLSKKG